MAFALELRTLRREQMNREPTRTTDHSTKVLEELDRPEGSVFLPILRLHERYASMSISQNSQNESKACNLL